MIVYTHSTDGGKMRRIEKTLLTGCGYTILILTLFYAFASISKLTSPAITFTRYLAILFFGFLISFTELAYNALAMKKWLRSLIRYGVLLLAFCVVFVITGNIKSGKAPAIFAAVIIFTLFYFSILGLTSLIKKTVKLSDDKIDRLPKKAAKPKQEYKPLYRSEKD